uniref:Uncharacterized protein n=1 Tax=Romanomermis culicivorax TaxID=13658 RepID=A0A915JXM3_ROMCU
MDVDIDIATQASSNEYTLGTELTSQDVYGQETTAPGSELTQPKAEAAKEPEDTEKLIKVIIEETPPPMVAASVPYSTARVEESDESDYVVEVEDEISAISDEEEAIEQRWARINHPQIQAKMVKASLMEIERSMIIAASFGRVQPVGAPQSSPSASICSNVTQSFQPSQAPLPSTGVWMPVRCTLPTPPIVQHIPQYHPRMPPINCQQCVMDVQRQEEICLLELVRVNLPVMLANPPPSQGQLIVQTPSSQSLPTWQATIIPATAEPPLLPPPPAQFQTSAGTQLNTERTQKT